MPSKIFKDRPPVYPRRISSQDSKLLRELYSLGGIPYKFLGELFKIAPNIAHHVVNRLGAYAKDK